MTLVTLLHPVIAVSKFATLVLGGLISFLSWRAYKRTAAPPLRALAVGFAIVTLGTFLGGMVDLLTAQSTLTGIAVSSILSLVGFAVITYSLYME
jgi:hypothetical protein